MYDEWTFIYAGLMLSIPYLLQISSTIAYIYIFRAASSANILFGAVIDSNRDTPVK